MIRWDVFDPRLGAWMATDRIPLDVVGGRAEGFRGTAETEDRRAIATLSFVVEDDTPTDEREWRTLGV